MSTCAVPGCEGSMAGQMLSCAAHWSLLPPELRVALVQAWDAMARAVIVGGDTAPLRARWQHEVTRAHVQWTELQHELAVESRQGSDWLRASRRAEQ